MVTRTVANSPLRTTMTLVATNVGEGAHRRLAELGLRAGSPLMVVRRTAGGGRVVAVAGSRIALDRETAEALTVEDRPTTAAAQEFTA